MYITIKEMTILWIIVTKVAFTDSAMRLDINPPVFLKTHATTEVDSVSGFGVGFDVVSGVVVPLHLA